MNIENALARYIDYGSKIELIERDIPVSDNSNFIKVLVGPRRAGKSSMMLILMQKLRKKGITPIFINGEDIDFVGITPENLDKIEDTIYKAYALSASKPVYLFIDEVQSFPEWSRWLRTLFDENKYNIFVSGSTSELTSDALPSELRGRSLETLVLPFSFKEYCTAKGLVYKNFMNTEQRGAIIRALSEYIDFGGYPEVVKESDDDSKKSILASLYATVLQHDIIEKYRIRKINEFKIFINAVFGSACRNISVPKIVHWFEGQGISINHQTVFNYLRYAESVFMIRLLYPYSKKPKERKTKPKAYPLDSGILGLFEKSRSKKLEDMVFVELLRRGKEVYYYKDSEADVDFVVLDNGKVSSMIQVSYSIADMDTYEREVGSIQKAAKRLHCSKAKIITFNEEKTINLDDVLIDVVPAWKWFFMQE
jgi:predicted AAA+ superfamily ATPase